MPAVIWFSFIPVSRRIRGLASPSKRVVSVPLVREAPSGASRHFGREQKGLQCRLIFPCSFTGSDYSKTATIGPSDAERRLRTGKRRPFNVISIVAG